MTSEPTIIDSPSDWVADHIRLYVETNGEEGHIWRGVPTLLLTVTGRKSGALRRTALIYGRSRSAKESEPLSKYGLLHHWSLRIGECGQRPNR